MSTKDETVKRIAGEILEGEKLFDALLYTATGRDAARAKLLSFFDDNKASIFAVMRYATSLFASPTEGEVERVGNAIVEWLEQCGDADIQAGIGTIFGLGTKEDCHVFREGVARAAISALRPPSGDET